MLSGTARATEMTLELNEPLLEAELAELKGEPPRRLLIEMNEMLCRYSELLEKELEACHAAGRILRRSYLDLERKYRDLKRELATGAGRVVESPN